MPLQTAPRVVELRWAGGLAIEPPLAEPEPGAADEGVRVLHFAPADSGFKLTVEGRSGSELTLRLHGEPPAGAEGGRPSSRTIPAAASPAAAGGSQSGVKVAAWAGRPRRSRVFHTGRYEPLVGPVGPAEVDISVAPDD